MRPTPYKPVPVRRFATGASAPLTATVPVPALLGTCASASPPDLGLSFPELWAQQEPPGSDAPYSIAEAERSRGPASIRRTDGRRELNAIADIDPRTPNANEILANLEATVQPEILTDYREVSSTSEGGQQEHRDTAGRLTCSLGFAKSVVEASQPTREQADRAPGTGSS